MKTNFSKLGIVGIAAMISATVAGRADAACKDSAPFLSKEYILNKGDCAVDKGIDAGESMLMDAGKNILSSALNSYLPGLGNLLFGDHSDPFAADTKKILDDIDTTRIQILDAIVAQARLADQATFNGLRTQAATWNNEAFAEKMADPAFLDGVLNDLDTLRFAFESSNYGVWHLHAYITVVQMLLELQADHTVVVNALARAQGFYSSDAEAIAQTSQTIQADWHTILGGTGAGSGVFDYLASLKRGNFYTVSDTRFVNVTTINLGSALPSRCYAGPWGEGVYQYNVYDTAPAVGSSATKSPFELSQFYRSDSTRCPPAFLSTAPTGWLDAYLTNDHALPIDTAKALWKNTTDAYTVQFSTNGAWNVSNPQVGLDFALAVHKEQEAQRYFIAGYGAARPIFDHWWDMVGNGALPQRELMDSSLNQFVDGTPNFGSDYFILQVEAPLGSPLQSTGDDRRWAANYLLSYGEPDLWALASSPSLDPIQIANGGGSADQYRAYLHAATPLSQIQDEQLSNFAGKVRALL